jgi:RNA polymerase sigma-70 factor, ECF subfamily
MRMPVSDRGRHKERARRVDMGAEQQIWQEYRAKLYRFVLGRVGDEAVAEEMVQDILARAYARRDTLRDNRKLRQWLYQIARNAIVDHYRKRRLVEELPDWLVDEEADARDDAEKDLARCLTPLVEDLPSRYRQAVELSEFEGFTQKEIASTLELSVSGAKSRVQRARRMLESAFLKCCRLEFDTRGDVTHCEPKQARNNC